MSAQQLGGEGRTFGFGRRVDDRRGDFLLLKPQKKNVKKGSGTSAFT